MTQTAVFRLWKGYQSPYSLGLAMTTPADPVPDSIDLLDGGLSVRQTGGSSSWIPTIAAPKDGLWADSQTQDGRQLLIKPMANATETFELVCIDRATANSAIAALNRYGQAAREFWAQTAQDPVYVEWAAEGGVGSQWALIYSLEASYVEAETLTPEGLGEPIILSVSFEREVAWRGIPFGVSPKIWAMAEYRGLQPTTTNPAGAGFYGYDNLDLGAGAGDYAPLVTATITQGDELGTVNVNYIDVDSTLIAGDAPALCQVSWVSSLVGQAPSSLFIGRTIRRDLYPSNNTTGSLATARQRMTLNAGDATLGAVANVTLTKPITADGWYSNGSIANRYVVSAVFAAGAAGNTNALRWTRRYSQYGGRYGVFMRHTVTAGTATAISVQATANLPDGTTIRLGAVTLNNTIAAGRGNLIYLGELNIPYRRFVDTDGTGLNDAQNIIFNLIFYKPGAGTPTMLIWDISLLPLDYGVVEVSALDGISAISTTYYDNTNYMDAQTHAALGTSNNQRKLVGQEMTLSPNADNRLYFLTNSNGGGFDMDGTVAASVDIVPRWYGVRDV